LLTISNTGLLSGTPTTATGSPFSFTVTATDGGGGTVTRTYSLTVYPALAFNTSSLPPATVGQNYSTQLTASGGTGKGYTFSAAGLPSWLTLSVTGLFSGTPTSTLGSPLSITVTLTDSNNDTSKQTFFLTIS
jgi:hypothetical protein